MTLIYFLYGLAFFSMGLAITLENNHGTDTRLKNALRPLAVFGFLHGSHEWIEMFQTAGMLPGSFEVQIIWQGIRLALLSFSFVSLSAFGAALFARNERLHRISLLLPLILTTLWAFGLLVERGYYAPAELWNVAESWTRYILGLPGALVASAGLVFQQREFRRAGMAQFGRDSLWAAIAFFWYGIVGQVFTKASRLPPSNIINQDLFQSLFGFPVQLLRAASAILAAIFVMRFLRSFEIEIQRQLAALQATRLEESQRREMQRGEILRRTVAAQEAERQRIARELHDETGQALTAIGLGLRGISNSLYQDTDKAAHNLKRLESMVDSSLNELQRLIADLRPSHLDDLGLPAALRWYAGEVQKRVPLQINLEVVGKQITLSSELKTTLFRLVQEALTNVIKHAEASHVNILLFFQSEAVNVSIEDDGCGFDMSKIGTSERVSWGLLGMQERTHLVNGECKIDSAPNRGTRIEVTIPYSGGGEEVL